MSVTSINYSEGKKKLNYKSVEISYNNLKKKKVFDSGNFVKDWYDCVKFIIMKLGNSEHHMNSSTVNHFIMDGAPYDSAWLNTDNTPKLVYKYFKGIELFVPKGTKPTWEELRSLCGDPPKQKKTITKKKK